jgi:hypothetical protein
VGKQEVTDLMKWKYGKMVIFMMEEGREEIKVTMRGQVWL